MPLKQDSINIIHDIKEIIKKEVYWTLKLNCTVTTDS